MCRIQVVGRSWNEAMKSQAKAGKQRVSNWQPVVVDMEEDSEHLPPYLRLPVANWRPVVCPLWPDSSSPHSRTCRQLGSDTSLPNERMTKKVTRESLLGKKKSGRLSKKRQMVLEKDLWEIEVTDWR
ncbi:unnamed protein product [Nezara viridula]|uniref:Uncharacterized protein n=1 Tax=Nezara viridula TaxID=85310 RepID=A0A9P0DZQ7_NEZVI|nr:unnamed protein product [Nezara viridula]